MLFRSAPGGWDGFELAVRAILGQQVTVVAARRLAGLCGTARGFMTSGRVKMQASAYQDSTGIKARRLTLQVDSLIRSTPICELRATRQPDSTVAGLMTRLRTYEAALREFRAAIGLPNR